MKPAAKTRTPKPARRKPAPRAVAVNGHAPAFREIIGLIQSARQRAFQAVNTELIGLYWRVGEYLPCCAQTEVSRLVRQLPMVSPPATQLREWRKLHEFYQLAMPKTK